MKPTQWTRVSGAVLLMTFVPVVTGAASSLRARPSPSRVETGWNHGMRRDSVEVFQRFCAACHGKSGQGNGQAAAYLNPRPADLTDSTIVGRRSDEELLNVITNGLRTMPAFGALLKPEELRAVASYVRSLAGG